MMKSPLEEYAPYRLLALFILIVFYGIYLAKAWIQKRCGIQTHQIGKRVFIRSRPLWASQQ